MEQNLADFVPPFCPRPRCPFHLRAEGWRWIHFGTFERQCEPQVIPR